MRSNVLIAEKGIKAPKSNVLVFETSSFIFFLIFSMLIFLIEVRYVFQEKHNRTLSLKPSVLIRITSSIFILKAGVFP